MDSVRIIAYELYQNCEGQLGSKQMLANLVSYFSDELVILRSQGCANVVGFRGYLCKHMKLVSPKNSSED